MPWTAKSTRSPEISKSSSRQKLRKLQGPSAQHIKAAEHWSVVRPINYNKMQFTVSLLTILSAVSAFASPSPQDNPLEGGCLSYGRGVGLIPKSCPSDKPNLQSWLCYADCAPGWKGIGPVCWAGWKGKGRGVGRVPNVCNSDRQNNQGLCYTPCKPGFHGIGPVCWQDSC